jgi:hypothetical protein
MLDNIGELYRSKYNTDLFVFVGIISGDGCFYNIRTGESSRYTLDYIEHFFISL